ncbi:hypothetical protein RFH07_00730 [Acinetobacter seifertii]|uniref:hypothetical protein n=1 Tax=Acinetobacter seifertii TaxID=1530123 RepID=UPI00280D8083|nr:hypothetical protein [Acinetobacter seifertii]MDQ9035155.1 hypothetical protein [Acinetobacter seifertii]
MNSKNIRQLHHLIKDGLDEKELKGHLQAIEELFGKEYLNSLTAKGELPILWKRLDFISTNELITLGMAISNLKVKQNPQIDEWLISTAKAVKKHSKNKGQSNGFIREIIFCGSICDSIGEVYPAKKAQQGYDLEIKTKNVDFVTSLKKFGKSDNHKQFEIFCSQLANVVKHKATYFKKNVQVCIILSQKLDEELFQRLKKVIYNAKDIDNIKYYENGILIMFSHPLSVEDLSINSASWQINVLSPENKNEQDRFLKKIIEEISNMKKTLDSSLNYRSLRTLHVNVHENCDIDSLQEKLVHYYKFHDDIGVDIVMIHKSAICESKSSNKLKDIKKAIYHDIRTINFEKNLSKRMLHFINTADISSAPLQMNCGVGMLAKIPFGTFGGIDTINKYNFQKGIYYFDMKRQKDGSWYADLISITPKGIQCEILLPQNLSSSIIGSKITPPHDDLLII